MIWRRLTGYLYLALAFFFCCTGTAWSFETAPSAPLVTAGAAVLLEADSGQVLYSKNGTAKMPPASTTKIMTVLLALEGGNLDRVVTVSPKAASVGEASIDLKAGEKLTLDDLIYGAMLKSGNDACVAIAEHVAGTESNFVLLMNQKAKVLGALNTSFINTNGLPATGHFTTARDLAIITRYALKNQSFQKAVSTRGKLIGSTEGERYLNNTNRLLWSYDGANGVKTGTTVEAGECLVASATRDGRQLINVVLHSEDRWSDSTTLLDYGFECFDQVLALQEQESFGWIAVREGTGDKVQAVVSNDLKVVIPKNRPDLIEKKVEITRELTAPVWDGQKVGRVIVSVNGIETESVDLVSDRYVEKLPFYRYIFKKGQQYYADGKGILFGITNTLKIAFWGGFYADG